MSGRAPRRGRAGDRGGRAGDRGGRDGRGGRRGRGNPVAIEIFSHGGPIPKPNSEVQERENDIAGAMPRPSDTMPQRPGYGTRGDNVVLWANYFAMPLSLNMQLFRYSIEASKREPAKQEPGKQEPAKQEPGKQAPGKQQAAKQPTGRMLKRLVELLIEDHFFALRNSIATDFKSNFISSSELLNESGHPLKDQIYDVRYRAENEEEAAQNARIYSLRLRETPTLQMSELLDYLACAQATETNRPKEEILQALNIVVNHWPKTVSTISSVGANKHFDVGTSGRESMSLGAGLQAMRGFFLSVRAVTSRLLVNVQVKQAAFYEGVPLVRLMSAYRTQNPKRLEAFLKGVRVRVTHIIKKNKGGDEIPRIKTISALATEGDGRGLEKPPQVQRIGGKAAGPKEVKFFLYDAPDQSAASGQSSSGNKGKGKGKSAQGPSSSGRYISVYDFFRSKYKNVPIDNPNLPVVNVGTRVNPSYLPADVCIVLSGQPSGTKLSSDQTQKMITFAIRPPAQNADSIVTNGASLLGLKPQNPTLHEFGLNVTPQLITVPGRVLACPNVRYLRGEIVPRSGSWNMQRHKFSTKSTLNIWTHLMIEAEGRTSAFRDDQHFRQCRTAFESKLEEMGMTVNQYIPGFTITVNPTNMDTEIDKAVDRIANNKAEPPLLPLPRPDLILVVLPFADGPMYNRIKLVCDVRLGVRNVCVVAPRFAKPSNDQYFANVALKFNLKLGGGNQYLEYERLGIIAEDRTMVVGIDVTHPSPGSSSNAPSVAGIVASVDRWLTQWPAEIRIQTSREEMVAALDVLLEHRLELWAKKHKEQLPENILVYRDGVSESQYKIVLEQELPLLRKACKAKYRKDQTDRNIPRITIVVVGKRHHTRFYPTTMPNADRSGNPQNGTVVDRQVTHARNWDFFLQAHAAIQGTARPAHYYIVLDEIFRHRGVEAPFQNAADVLEDLTHNMCYTFGRACKAVSVCPPAYYADLVCTRARCYLSPLFEATPGNTPTPSVSGSGPAPAANPSDIYIHPRVRDTMFYI